MNRNIRSAVCLALTISSACATPENQSLPGDLVIRRVTVISAERSEPLEHAYVLIRDGRIAEVSVDPISADEEIDGTGKYLIPGLIDGHVHLGDVPGMRPAQQEVHPEIVQAALAQEPRSYLYFGFTTLVDLIGLPERISRWNSTPLHPDVLFCGGAPVANGYPMVFVPESDRFRIFEFFLYDERQRNRIPDGIDPAEHTPESVVRRMAEGGAACVKTFYETGFGGMRNLPVPTLEMARALVAAAHERGMPVLMHANSKEAQDFAVAAGVDVIAHGMWNGYSIEDIPGAELQALLKSIEDSGMGYQPTIQVLHGEVDLFDEDFLDDPMVAHAVPASLIEWYRTTEAGWFRDQIAENLDGGDATEIYAPVFKRLNLVVRSLAGTDARLLFGSDTPSAPTYANPPGMNGWLEMRNWIEAGVSEDELFRALTIDNARAFGLEGDLGSVEEGKVAHLLLLDQNPLEDVSAYNIIRTVILAGRPIERGRLSASRD